MPLTPGSFEEAREGLLAVHVAGAEHAERSEQVEALEPDEHRMPAAHRQPGQRAASRAGLHAVLPLHEWNHVLAQFSLEGRERELDVPGIVAVDDLVVGDGDDHRHDLPLGQQVVHDQVHAAVVDPVVGQVAAAANQIEHGVLPRPIVARGRVDVQLTLASCHARVIDVARHGAVGHVARVVVGRRTPVDHQLAVGRHGGDATDRIVGVGHLHAVHHQMVDVHVGRERPDRQRPHAVGALLEGHRRALAERHQDGHTRQRHGARLRRFQPERRRAVVADVRRVERCAERDKVFGVLLRVVVQVDIRLLRQGRAAHHACE